MNDNNKYEWLEQLCTRGGWSAQDRAVIRKLADHIYMLNERILNLEETLEDRRRIISHLNSQLILSENSVARSESIEDSEVTKEVKKKKSNKKNA